MLGVYFGRGMLFRRFLFIFIFLCFAATQLARQLHQERLQVVYRNRVARKRTARTPAMDLKLKGIRTHM